MKTFKLIVQGNVQGVGYRNYAKMLADQYDIKGTVRNQSNGDVMIIAQGDNVTPYIQALKVPQHRLMRIDHIEMEDYSTDKVYDKFSAVY
ncbi:acylphosphatase [Aerococcaceae bacterium DSM 111020]|nr:acylphosphatase [Aerococcaceae bacterium DSM 111020]